MFTAMVTVMISVVLAGMVASVCINHDSYNEIVNWDGQR